MDNKTHQTVRELEVHQQRVAAFIESGKIVQVCSGSCEVRASPYSDSSTQSSPWGS